MRIYRRVFSVLLISVLMLFSNGCSFDFSSVESLMRAPKLTGEYADIERAFESAVGTSVSLLSPRAGDYRTAFVLQDFDADGEDEAIVFYTTTADNSTVHMHFLDCNNGTWVSSDDEIGKEKDVHELLFRDLNNDGIPEIIVNFNTKLSSRSMLVYGVTPADDHNLLSVQLLSNVQYSSYTCVDMDLDGQTEILYTVFEVSVDTGLSVPFVRILKYVSDFQGPHIDIVSSLSLHSGITSFVALAADSSDNAVRVYIDCGFHDALTMITEVVTWSPENGYLLLLHKFDSAALLKTTRANGLLTADTDKDGVMEIPGEYEMPNSIFENLAEGMLPLAIGRNYYHCTPDGALTLYKAEFADPFQRYQMDLLQLGIYGRVCMVFDCISESTQFYLYDSDVSIRGEHLFTIWFKDVNNETCAYFDIGSAGKEIGFTPDLLLDSLTINETEV